VHSTISIDVAAPPRRVFDLARDVRRWPQLLPHYVSIRCEDLGLDGSVTARLVAIRTLVPVLGIGLPVAWRARSWSEPDALRIRFVHRGGATNGMDVTWRIEPTAGGCRVSIEHDFRPRVPGWAWFVDRAFTRPIAGRTLGTFKTLAETLAEPGPESSDPVGPTNQPS
jgi:ribosome-associated toxin RatA of RatAB toxin-antitoxin module